MELPYFMRVRVLYSERHDIVDGEMYVDLTEEQARRLAVSVSEGQGYAVVPAVRA